MAYKPPLAGFVSDTEMTEWLAALPTLGGEADLKKDAIAVLEAETAEAAYHNIAIHLMPEDPLPPVARTLTSLAGHLAQRTDDQDGAAFAVYRLGLALCDLAPHLQPASLTNGIVQLNHRIWLLRDRQRRTIPSNEIEIEDLPAELTKALASGDNPTAMVLARRAAANGLFWPILSNELQRILGAYPADHALQACAIVGETYQHLHNSTRAGGAYSWRPGGLIAIESSQSIDAKPIAKPFAKAGRMTAETSAILRVLADETRQRILHLLRHGGVFVGELQTVLDLGKVRCQRIAPPAKLRGIGLVHDVAEGPAMTLST